ncbi:uncharacterized protein LOC144364938 isoform X2 [Ictidomys tridecemlineatus]
MKYFNHILMVCKILKAHCSINMEKGFVKSKVSLKLRFSCTGAVLGEASLTTLVDSQDNSFSQCPSWSLQTVSTEVKNLLDKVLGTLYRGLGCSIAFGVILDNEFSLCKSKGTSPKEVL